MAAATPATGPPVVEEGKLLSESLSTVKIQVQQMRRYLVRLSSKCEDADAKLTELSHTS